MNRRKFLTKAGIALPTVALLAKVQPAMGQARGNPQIQISNPHGHTLKIPIADLMNSRELSYDIRGTANHTHTVRLVNGDIVALLKGEAVEVISTNDFGHVHAVKIQIPALTS